MVVVQGVFVLIRIVNITRVGRNAVLRRNFPPGELFNLTLLEDLISRENVGRVKTEADSQDSY